MKFRLLTYLGDGGSPRPGLLVGEETVVDLDTTLDTQGARIHSSRPVSLLSVLEAWDKVRPMLDDIARDFSESSSPVARPLSETRLAAPVLYPHNIYCAAANYADHAKEMSGRDLPDKGRARPYFFSKLPRQAVIGPDEPIRIPHQEAKVDWEAEIGVVMGRRCRNVSSSEAMKCVAGYTIVNDVSDRARIFREDWDFRIDWLGGKSFDTSAPMGPWITPAEFISDPHNLTIRLWVNDELMQNSSSRLMHFSIPEQIEYLSQLMTLLPGDVIATGTPAGVGHPRGLFLKPGDRVTITVEGLGSLTNPVVAGY